MPNNNFKNNRFVQNFRENRAVWITAITLLVALAVIATVATVANRSKKPPDITTTTDAPSTTTAPTTNAPDPSTDVVDILPTFVAPVSGSLTKNHDAETQVFSNTMNDYRVHLGVDIETAVGAEVFAAADGTVAEIWEDPMMGYCVAINHSGDAVSIYKNLKETVADGIVAGTKVKAGQTIAYVGESAMTELADEPHLHFEMTVSGLQVDPMNYLDEEAVQTLSQAAYEDAE